MRKLVSIVVVLLCSTISVRADLQNIQIGGELTLRYRHYFNVFNDQNPGGQNVRREIRIPDMFLTKRPIGPRGVSSLYRWDDRSNDRSFVESLVLLNVRADFTQGVSAFIELNDFAEWGEDFRSDWITGNDARAQTADDLEINQAYVEANDTFGLPVRVRIGRQSIKFGKGWLVADRSSPTRPSPFDGIRITYKQSPVQVDVFATKLAEVGVREEDGDTDFYGIYGTYDFDKTLQLSAYWFWLRDARSWNDTNFPWFVEWLENLFGVDDYDVTNLHTVGVRLLGKWSELDYDLEAAYQFGEADIYGQGFVPVGLRYGADDAEFDNWAAEANFGYTFDAEWSPRLVVFGSYFQGHDNRDITFWDWINPFYKPEASLSFNRLFSQINHMQTVNDTGGVVSNFAQAGVGIEAKPMEKISLHFHVAKDWIVAPFDPPVTFRLGRFRIPIAPALSFWTEEGSKDLGWEIFASIRYDYSEDLYFLLSYNYLFVGKGLSRGAFIQWNGTDFAGGTDDDDASYLCLMSSLKF